MTNSSLSGFPVRNYAYLFILLHVLAWSVAPALIRHNLPLDAIEGTIWGHQLEWGYDKNPFLNGWLTALATYLDNRSAWMIYLFSQISVGLCLWSVWRLSSLMFPPIYALISIMILEGVQYFNLHAIDFNDNTLELGLWALAIYFYYLALRWPNYLYWIATSIICALGLMAKYYTGTLMLAMALFLIMDKTSRRQLKTLPPYVALGVFLAIIFPHLIWLFQNNFITVKYVFDRASSHPNLWNHLYFPLQFAWQQLQAFSPALVLVLILFLGKKNTLPLSPSPSAFDRKFLFFMGMGPFILTIIVSLISGSNLRAGWGMPLLSFWGVILLGLLKPYFTKVKLYIIMGLIYFLMLALIIAYAISLIRSPDPSSANFPGAKISNVLTQKWRDTYHTKLSFVAGSRWLGGNISYYSADKPAVFVEWDVKRAPWVKLKKLKKHGAIFVWDITDNEMLPTAVKAAFPTLEHQQELEFDWRRNAYHLAPIKIGVAFLPPA